MLQDDNGTMYAVLQLPNWMEHLGFVKWTDRAVLPKAVNGRGQRFVKEKVSNLSQASDEGDVGHGVGYALQLTFDVPVGKHIGVLDVRFCWHDIVYQAQVDFGRLKLQY